MIEKYHPIRKQAEKDYKHALKLERLAEQIPDELAHMRAVEACKIALHALVDAEIKYPTNEEIKKEAKLRYLRNRGLDV